MLRSTCTLLLSLSPFLPWSVNAEPNPPFVLESLVSTISVKGEGSLDVSERLRLAVSDVAPARLVRRVRTVLTTKDHVHMNLKLKDISASVDGKPCTLRQEAEAGLVKLVLDTSCVTARRGATVEISYQVVAAEDGKGFIGGHSEFDGFIWPVNDPEDELEIGSAMAAIHLPHGVDGTKVLLVCYTGHEGTQTNECEARQTAEDSWVAISLRALNVHESFVVDLSWPKGHLQTNEQQLRRRQERPVNYGSTRSEFDSALTGKLLDRTVPIQERRYAAAAAGNLPVIPSYLYEPFLKLLEDEDAQLRFRAMVGLIRAGAPAAETVMAAFRRGAMREPALALEIMRWYGPRVSRYLPDFTAALQGQDMTVTAAALRALGGLGIAAAGSVPQIAAKLESPSLRVQALLALGRIRSPHGVPYVVRYVREADPTTRRAAGQALNQLAPLAKDFEPQIITAFIVNQDPHLAAALGTMRSEGAVPALRSALESGDLYLHSEAAAALRRIPTEAARKALQFYREKRIPELIYKFEHGDDKEKCSVAYAFATLGPLAKPALASLLSAIDSGDSGLCENAMFALGFIDADSTLVVEALEARLKEPLTKGKAVAVASTLAHLGTPGSIALFQRNLALLKLPLLENLRTTEDRMLFTVLRTLSIIDDAEVRSIVKAYEPLYSAVAREKGDCCRWDPGEDAALFAVQN